MKIAYFISPHGFGHAARAISVMSAIHQKDPNLQLEIYTQVPPWFFEESYPGNFQYHSLLTDIGLVQKTSLHENISDTLEALNQFYPLDDQLIDQLASQLQSAKCDLVLCDIAPIGILAAKHAGIPSILIENFTWDWIYEGYRHHQKEFKPHIAYLKKIFESVDYHIQAHPVCHIDEEYLAVNPISREPVTSPEKIRKKLHIPAGMPFVLITMGGIAEKFPFLEKLYKQQDIYFVIPGGAQTAQNKKNVILLAHKTGFYHPDLVHASDLVIGKLGYSTLAEVYYAGVTYGFVTREHFRESKELTRYVQKEMPSFSLNEDAFYQGDWAAFLSASLNKGRVQKDVVNGAQQIANFIWRLFVSSVS